MRQKIVDFEEWSGGASDEELEELKKQTKKRYHMFLLISIIPIVNWITMGMAIFCYNNYNIIKSRGYSSGNGIWRLILLIYSFIIIPLIVINICAKFPKAGNAVLGWKE